MIDTLIIYRKRTSSTTTWNGSWSNGTPNSRKDAILAAAYTTATSGSFSCRNLTINANLTISTGKKITVLGTSVTQATGKTFTIADGGEFVLLHKDVNVSTVKVTINRVIPGLQLNDYMFLSCHIIFFN